MHVGSKGHDKGDSRNDGLLSPHLSTIYHILWISFVFYKLYTAYTTMLHIWCKHIHHIIVLCDLLGPYPKAG